MFLLLPDEFRFKSRQIETEASCEACSRSGGFLVQCTPGWNTKTPCNVFLHPLCAELSQRMKKKDAHGVILYKCALHSFGRNSACRICKLVHRQKEMIKCDICSGHFHVNCLDPPLKTTPPDNEWFCTSCIEDGLAKGTIVEKAVDGRRASKRSSIKKYSRVETSLALSPSTGNTGNVLTELKKNKSKSKRSATMIEDGAEMYFTKAKHKSTRSTPALNTARITEVGTSSSSEDEQESIETTTAAAAPASREKQDEEKDLLCRWPNPHECVERIINNPLRHASELAKIELKYKAKFKEWAFLLQTNHSLLFYGYGSKRKLLEDFAKEELGKEGYVANIQGYW